MPGLSPGPVPERLPAAAAGLVALALLASAVLVPGARAGVEGEVRFDLVGLEEAEIDARLTLDGEAAQRLREQVDDDGDGEVGELEAAGAGSVIVERVKGPTEAYTLDGHAYENALTTVRTDGLAGPANRTSPVTVELAPDARAEAGQPPHVFAVHGAPASLPGDAELAYTVRAPEGYVLADADGFVLEDACHARSPPGEANASVRLVPKAEACDRPIPAPGAGALAVLAAAAALAERRAR